MLWDWLVLEIGIGHTKYKIHVKNYISTVPYSDYQATNFNFFITVPNNAGSVTIFFTVPYNAYPDTVAVPNNASKHNNSCIDPLSVFSSSASLCAGNLSVHWTEYPSLHTRQSSVRNITSWRQQARPGARSCPNFLDSHKMKSWGKILLLGNTSGNSPSPHRASFSNFPLILE